MLLDEDARQPIRRNSPGALRSREKREGNGGNVWALIYWSVNPLTCLRPETIGKAFCGISKELRTEVNVKKHDKKYHMLRKLRTKRFPYTEVRTKRGTDACPYRLADDLLNWLAWEFVEPAKWPWVFRGTTRHDYRLESSLDRKLRDRAESGIADSDSAIDRQSAEDYLISQFRNAATTL